MTLKKHVNFIYATSMLILMMTVCSFSQTPEHNVDPKNLPTAVQGYDVTTYYTAEKPSMGNTSNEYIYQNRRYLFANKENLSAFSANPEKYTPEFSGLCALSASNNELQKSNPEIFTVQDGKLLLFKDVDAQSKWQLNTKHNYSKAKNFLEVEYSGYDVTTYFTSGKPQRGSEFNQAVYQGRRYYFATPENREMFSENPTKYVSEFGSHCAFSASLGQVHKANASVFTISQGKLLLFKDSSALTKWKDSEELNYSQAKDFWQRGGRFGARRDISRNTNVKLFNF